MLPIAMYQTLHSYIIEGQLIGWDHWALVSQNQIPTDAILRAWVER